MNLSSVVNKGVVRHQKGAPADVLLADVSFSDVLAQISELERILQADDAWDSAAIGDVLSQFGAGVLWLAQDDVVMGYCIYSVVFEVAEVLRIGTHPDFQRQGVAVRLLDELFALCGASDECESVLLEVRADNAPAIALYERVGFGQIDVRKNYYRNANGASGTDALIMQRSLG
ncbi:ribosomal-protein-alanine N-acetyltransferase [Moraxella caviae]|uniref:Ribosomal-protein-alanine N-acetyltransferase n=2 Tax=Moraxella caviae TaxID=34060 RepID=A0A378R7E2_9GAMM|nr:ribosomal protein S18-alanine N-acetyltransferase [Moraxella caviae]STZ13983.1 ribosomal-protein-alanine N-acetyltransferase [Moraxella caviae]VEW11509.1 ribosomal-protein-alanine N-acetyltransferase [Moraxella caviae]VEW13260.1 ribosomal-protein-alanine N-acetyltransferase [Moraxella caviae]